MKTSKVLYAGAAILTCTLIIVLYSGIGISAADSSKNTDITAKFIAGMGSSENPALSRYAQSSYYRNYASRIKSGWDRFQKPNMEKIASWWSSHAPDSYNSTVLYPFSGPDIMNALTFFPDAKLYIMFGLESPGTVPDATSMPARSITRGLNNLQKSLNTIFHVNFFRTKGMAKNLGNKSFNGTTGLLMFFLSMNGYEVLDARKIAIDSRSRIASWKASDDSINWQKPPASRRIPGVEIVFRRKGKEPQKLRYFMLNVIDYALANHSPNFIPYLEKEGPFTTIIKSASYLMHNDTVKFTRIRSAILSNSDYILQDDSGIPLRYLKKDNWKVTFHGFYNGPIPLFSHRMQKDLKAAMEKYSTGILPFSYGYDYRENESNLITAEKKSRTR